MADIIAKEKQLSSAITTFISAIKSRVLALGYYLRAGTSYENNQLVRKKDIWKDTSIVYKDVSIGTSSNPDGDIPAGGGQRRALATVTYKLATRTTYLDGSYTDSTYESKSATIYGSYISAESLGTTIKARTKIGTSTPSGTVAGAVRTATGVDIYLLANAETSVDNPTFSLGTVSDIPAGGGTSDVPDISNIKLVHHYTSGATNNKSESTYTIYYGKATSPTSTDSTSCLFTASSLDTTIKARTKIGSAYVKITCNGLSTENSVEVYLQANAITSYDNPTFTLGTVTDIPAEGGTSSVPSITNVRQKRYYTSGSESTTTLSSYTVYYGKATGPTSTNSTDCQFTVSSLGTTAKSRTKLGDAYIKITANSKSTENSTAVYLAANAVSNYANPTFDLGSISDVPASGGTSAVPAISNVKQVYTYNSGSTLTVILTTYTVYYGKATSPTSTIASSCQFTASDLGTTVKSRTQLGTAYIKVTANSKSTEKSTKVYQQANLVIQISGAGFTYSYPTTDVPAGGGTSEAPSVTSVSCIYYYTSGSSKTEAPSSYTVYYGTASNPSSTSASSATFTGSNLDSTFKVRTKLGTGYVKVVAEGMVSMENSFDVYQEANYITTMEPIPVTGYSAHVTYSSTTIGAGGGSVSPSANGACNYTFNSGTVVYNSTTAPFSGVSVSYSRSYSEQSDPSNAFTLNTSTGAVSASSRGTTTGNARSCTVRATLTTTLTYTNSTYSSNFPAVSNGVRNDDFTITQLANSATYANPTFTLGNIADVPAAGGTSAVPTISNINQVVTFSSGSETSTNTGYTIYYGKSTNPTSTSSSSCLFTGSNLGNVTSSRAKLGTAYIKITMNSKSTTNSKDVYLEANQIEADWVDISAGPSTQYIEASGGTVYPSSDTSDYLIEEFVSYTSGELDNLGAAYLGVDYDILFSKNGTTWYNSASSVSITGSNLGTTVKAETQLGTFYVRAGGAGVEYGETYSWAVKQKANAITAESISLSLGTISDIPASGGTSSLHSKTTTLTKTYTSGSTANSTLSSGVTYTYSKNGSNYYSSTSYGKYTASSLGMTVKARTSLGTIYVKATYSSSVSGSLTSTASKAVYQEANSVTYGNPQFTLSVPDVPASGGDSAKPTIGTVTLSTSYTSGSTGSVTISSYTPYFAKNTLSFGTTSSYWVYTGEHLGTRMTARTALGTVYVKITANNKTTTNSVTVYLESNTVESAFVTFTPGSVTDAPAGGGYCGTPSAGSFLTNHIYTSGSSTSSTGGYTTYYKNNDSLTSWTTTATSARIYASSLGTTTKSRTKIGEIYIYVVDNDDFWGAQSGTTTVNVYQGANTVTYVAPSFTLTYTDIPAEGGDSTPTVSSILLTRGWTSGSSITDTPTSYTIYYGKSSNPTSTDINSAKFTASSLGTTMKTRTHLGSGYVKVVANGKSASKSKACYLAANYITSIEAEAAGGYSYHVSYDTYTIGAGGGTATPSGSARCYYTFASGSTAYSNSTSPFTGVTATYTRTYSEYVDYYGKFDVDSSTGVVTAYTRGTTTGSSWNVTVSAVLTISITYSSTFNSLPKPSNSTMTSYPTISLEANSATYGTPSFTISGCTNAPASGGYTGTPVVLSVMLIIHYTSGSTLPASTSGYTAYYGTTSSPTSTSATSGRRYASSLGTTLQSSNKGLGYIYVKVTVNGVSKTNSKYVYQNANVVTNRILVADPYYSDVGAWDHYAEFNLGTVLGRVVYTSGSYTTVTASNVSTSFSATPDSIFTEIDSYGDWYTINYGAKLYPNSFYTLVYVGEDVKPMRRSPATTITVTATVDGVSLSLTYTRYAHKEPSKIESFGMWNSNQESYTYGIYDWPTSWAKNTTYMGKVRYNPAIMFTGGFTASTTGSNTSYDTYAWYIVVDSSNNSVLVKQSNWMNSNMSNTRYKYIQKITITNVSEFYSYMGNYMYVTLQGNITSNSTAQSNIKLIHKVKFNLLGTPTYTSSYSQYSYSIPSNLITNTYTGYTVSYTIHN